MKCSVVQVEVAWKCVMLAVLTKKVSLINAISRLRQIVDFINFKAWSKEGCGPMSNSDRVVLIGSGDDKLAVLYHNSLRLIIIRVCGVRSGWCWKRKKRKIGKKCHSVTACASADRGDEAMRKWPCFILSFICLANTSS